MAAPNQPRGSIKATDAYITSVNANFGNLESTIQAGTYIHQVTATHNITGSITAGTYIGDTTYNTGIKSIAGNVSGNILAGTDIASVLAGKHIQGTVTAGRDINLIKSGILGGGNIEKNITATRNLGTVIAISLWSETQTPSVYTASALPQKGMDFPPGSEKFTHLTRPRPAKPNMATSGSYGNIQGKLKAESIGGVTAFGNIDKDIATTQTLGAFGIASAISAARSMSAPAVCMCKAGGKGGAVTTHSTDAAPRSAPTTRSPAA